MVEAGGRFRSRPLVAPTSGKAADRDRRFERRMRRRGAATRSLGDTPRQHLYRGTFWPRPESTVHGAETPPQHRLHRPR